MSDKFKSILHRELTPKETTALVAVFFIAFAIVFSILTSEPSVESHEEIPEREEIPEPIENSQLPKKKSKYEIVRAEVESPKIDPFSKDHLTREKISELKSKPEEKIETESEIEDKIEKSVEDSVVKIENKIEEKIEKIVEPRRVPRIKLKGIIFAGKNSVAIIDLEGEQDLMVGDSIDGFRIEKISRDFILLDSGDKIFLESEGDDNF